MTSDSAATAEAPGPPATAGTPARRRPRALARRSARQGRRWVPVLVIGGYLLIALAAYWPLWPGDPNRLPLCACSDPVQGVWFLGWIPVALGHLHNPFFTTLIDHPVGANLAQNTEMPLLGLLTAPLSVAVSPVASFNLVMWLAYPLSATSLYLVLRRVTRHELAAVAAGLAYGFSAYVVGEGFGHPNLSFVPLPPVLLALAYELLVVQRRPPLRQGCWLGAAAAAQYLISPEVLATTALMAVLGVAGCALARPRQVTAARLAHAARGLVPALLLAGAVVAYPLWFLLAGPHRFHGSVQGPDNPYRADLLGPIVPTPAEALAPASLKATGASFTGATFPENGSYLGVVLLATCIALVVAFRRNRWLVGAAAMALVAFVLSLGPSLVVGGHATGVPLPFALLLHVPLLANALPSRLSLYQDGFVAVVVGLGIDELLERRARRLAGAGSALGWARARVAGAVAIGVASLALVVPAWPEATFPTDVPALFSSPQRSALVPTGGVVLTYPFAVSPDDQAMLWQAVDGYRFSLIGGYALIPDAAGHVSPWPPELRPVSVQAAIGYEAMGPAGYLTSTLPDLGPAMVRDTRRYLRDHHVATVVVDPHLGNNPALVADLFRRALGRPGTSAGGTLVWAHVAQLLGDLARA